MKKILFAIALVLTISLAASAQRDGFFTYNNNISRMDDDIDFMFPNVHGSQNNTPAPLGTGLFILGALGVGYAVMRKKKSSYSKDN